MFAKENEIGEYRLKTRWFKSNKSIPKQYEKLKKKFQKSVSSVGNNLRVFGETEVLCGKKIVIGNDFRINSNVYINAQSGVNIGNDVTLSYGAKIITTGYDIEHWMKTGEKIHFTDKPISIGDHCWIGAGATILPGVSIKGEYVVVAADAVVTKDILEDKVIVAGNPAKIIKRF